MKIELSSEATVIFVNPIESWAVIIDQEPPMSVEISIEASVLSLSSIPPVTISTRTIKQSDSHIRNYQAPKIKDY